MKLSATLAALVGLMAANAQAGELLVGFEKHVLNNVAQAEIAQRGYTVTGELPMFNIYRVETPAGISQAQVDLAAIPGVLAVTENLTTKWIEAAGAMPAMPSLGDIRRQLAESAPEVPAFEDEPVAQGPGGDEEISERPWGIVRVNAPATWPSNKGKGVKVAVVDTGIDEDHPEFAGRILGGLNAVDKNAPWDDDHSHGTHCAGIIGAALDGAGTVGVAPEVSFLAVKVLTKEGSGSLFAIMEGLQWAVQQGADVISMSLGAPQDNFLFKLAMDQVAAADVPVIAAAGNDGKAVNFPAAYDSTIAVSAQCPPGGAENAKLCTDKEIANFSSRGPQIEFIAPGVLNMSTVIGGGYKAYSGTSMATPHVSGLAALAIARGAKGIAGVRAALKGAARKLPGLSASEQGNGLIDAAAFR